MTTSTYKYVVLGAGNSAGYVAREFVARAAVGAKGDLCLVGEEPVLPYERPALSKAVLIKGNVRLPGFHTCVGGGGERQTADWYADKGIDTMLGEKVTECDLANKTLITDKGNTIIASQALILATGAAPIYLSKLDGAQLNGIHYLRDNQQAVALYDALQVSKGKTVVVVGGGYIGMEVAAAAHTVGCKVKMLFPEANIMPRLFTPDIAAHYERVYKQDKGIEFINDGALCKGFVEAASASGCVGGVKYTTKDGEEATVEADLVVVGVGASPNTQLFKDQLTLDARRGVVVDSTLKTSVDGVYAIGDIAKFPCKMYGGRPVRMEHVVNCRQSAQHAVGSILNDTNTTTPYDYLPYFYSRVFHLSWKFYGDPVGTCTVVGDFNPKLIAIWVSSDSNNKYKINGVFMESPDDGDTAAMQNIARNQPTVDIEAFKKSTDPSAALALLAP